jgi:hypothetical protein
MTNHTGTYIMPSHSLSDEVCKNIIRRLARKHGIIPPSLITTKLMSEDDKNDMRNGLLPISALEAHIVVWKEQGCEDKVFTKHSQIV